MSTMISKSTLAIKLSTLDSFSSPSLKSEQYQLDSEIAAEILWFAYMNGDLTNRIIADFGCGTGVLGIGCLLLDAKMVYFVDNDMKALQTAADNLKSLQFNCFEILNKNIADVSFATDVVIQNPPFGTKIKHADREFLIKAFETANVIYSIHKATSINFVSKIADDHGFNVTHQLPYKLPLKKQFDFHKRKIHKIDIICFRLTKS